MHMYACGCALWAPPPNTHSLSLCRFSFGKTPVPEALDDTIKTACFAQCTNKHRTHKQVADEAKGVKGAADCSTLNLPPDQLQSGSA